MADIRLALKEYGIYNPIYQEVGEILIEYYETMKALEKDSERGGKQATKIVMTINDIIEVFNEKP